MILNARTVLGLALLALLVPSLSAQNGGRKQIACDVAILGGGAGGLHTAFRLGAKLGANVCLFEKENRLGGRIYDVAKDDNNPNSPVFGLGALRIMETQDVVFGLAKELNIAYESVGFSNDKIIARGTSDTDSEMLRSKAYPLTTASEGDLYTKLLDNPERANITKYGDFRTYARTVLGGENTTFLAEVFRFRGDFTYPLSARGYMEFLDEDWNVCCTPSYPVGGMSAFIRGMEQKALASGVRIFKGEPAIEVNTGAGGARYQVLTTGYDVRANRLVIAIDADAFRKVGGNLAARIQAQPQFQDLVGVKVASINQWWPSAWWKGVVPGNRAWSTETCTGFLEIPTAKYAADQLVTRTVYNDDLNCANFWEITAQRGIGAVEAEIERGLKSMFPGANIPKPVKTVVKIWPAGWYWLRAGSPYSNAQIATWAVLPFPEEQVSLVGESYNPQRSTWSDGAFKSSINVLNSLYGMQLEGQTASPNGVLPNFGNTKKLPPGLRKKR
jgi:hypothetical protein